MLIFRTQKNQAITHYTPRLPYALYLFGLFCIFDLKMSSTNLTATAIESNNAGDGGDNVGELSFVQGDVISIISDEGNGTYLCECNGRVGYVFEYLLDFGNGETIHYGMSWYYDAQLMF